MTVGLSLVGTGTNPDGRPNTDFYSTPEWATQALVDREVFSYYILEPACGDGSMAKILKAQYEVLPLDLYDWGYGDSGWNFMEWEYSEYDPHYDVVTNPPYRFAEEFLRKGLEITKPYNGKVALLLKLQFLEGQKRASLLKNSPLKTVYVFSKRLTFSRDNKPMANGGMMAFAWYVWDWSHSGPPIIDWI